MSSSSSTEVVDEPVSTLNRGIFLIFDFCLFLLGDFARDWRGWVQGWISVWCLNNRLVQG